MTRVNSISTPFGNIRFIGHLLCRYYPTTSIYSKEDNTPVIVEWIDEYENGDDISIIYESSIQSLSDYINGKISHLDLIHQTDSTYYKFINSIDNASFHSTTLKGIGKKNLPGNFSFFSRSESRDVNLIESTLGLIPLEIENNEYFEALKSHSEVIDSGLFRLHINKNATIGHGTADTRILGELLISFEDLYNEVAKDVFRGINRDGRSNNIADERNFLLTSRTEVIIQEAASFSIYLKSKREVEYSESESEFRFINDEIFSKLNQVIQSSSNVESIDSIKNHFSPDVFGKVQNFATTIFVHKLIVDLDYYNASSEAETRQMLLPSTAHGIFVTVENTSFERKRTIQKQGKFTSININTGHFVFKSIEDIYYKGYFSDTLYENISAFNFREIYNVSIDQKIIEFIGKRRSQYSSILVSCVVVNN